MSIETRESAERADSHVVRPERLTAMEAIVRLLVDQAALDRRAGLNTGGFATGYPGSPLGGLQGQLEKADERLKAAGVHQTPGLNEELAATAVWGSQAVTTLPGATVDGVFGLWYGKAPGVDRAADALRHANIRGAHPHGGALVLAGDDPNANATVFPTDSNTVFQAMGMPVLFPGNVQEILDLGHHGYQLSRIAGLWVGFKLVTTVADGSGSVDTSLDRLDFQTPTVDVGGVPFRPILRANDPGPAMREAERDLIDGRRRLAEKYIELNDLNPTTVDSESATVGLVAPGKTYYDLRQSLATLGLDDVTLRAAGVRLKKISALYPIGVDEWVRFADGLEHIIVVEEKRPFLESALKGALYGRTNQPTIVGKQDAQGAELMPSYGEFGPDLIARRLAPILADRGIATVEPSAPVGRRSLPVLSMQTSRQPFFCSGCPHNTSLKAPEGSLVGAGIGCHIMSLLVKRPEYGEQTGFTQMGGEGAQWVGQAPFTTDSHIFQNVGDGTFHHSASLGVRLAVANQSNITFKILYNSAVGMTGGQDIKGVMGVPELTRSLEAEGVKRIIITSDDPKRFRKRQLAAAVTDVWHRDRLVEAQEVLARVEGVTVLIHDQQCAADRRRRWRSGAQEKTTKRVYVNQRVCEGCGDCNDKSQCLSVQPVETAFGRKTQIQQTSCNLDFSCLKGDCPSFLTVDVKKATRSRRKAPAPPDVPVPTQRVERDRFSVHMTGIGGTGVVSANDILAAAAAHDGLRVRSLDLPGASIKAGTVVSQLQVFEGESDVAATIDPGSASLYLGFDILGVMTEANLSPLGAGRTLVVATTSLEPTGQMAVDPSVPLPAVADICGQLDQRSRPADNVYLDVASICDALFGNQGSANALLIGAAFQAGAIPFSLASIEQAFRDGRVAVESNLQAFAWGRAAVARPDLIPALGIAERPSGGGAVPAPIRELLTPFEGRLADDVAIRVEDLLGYQGQDPAVRFVDRVAAVMSAEIGTRGESGELTESYARGLHKLMAYKDEYEVARLMLLESSKQAVVGEFGSGAKVSWNLHPPILRAMGVDRKIRLGPWFRPAFVLLRSLRHVRGTVFDIFGYASLRRLERRLIEEYDVAMTAALEVMDDQNIEKVCELARTPELVRGYEYVKVANVLKYVARVEEIGSQIGSSYRIPSDVRVLIQKASA